MPSLILRAMAPGLTSLMFLFSLFILLRGHNEPGGGFIGGLIAASALAIYGIGCGVPTVRRALYFDPLVISGMGLLLATGSGLLSLMFRVPFLTGLWTTIDLFGDEIAISTPMVFDIGVYLVVFGSITSIVLALEEGDS